MNSLFTGLTIYCKKKSGDGNAENPQNSSGITPTKGQLLSISQSMGKRLCVAASLVPTWAKH